MHRFFLGILGFALLACGGPPSRPENITASPADDSPAVPEPKGGAGGRQVSVVDAAAPEPPTADAQSVALDAIGDVKVVTTQPDSQMPVDAKVTPDANTPAPTWRANQILWMPFNEGTGSVTAGVAKQVLMASLDGGASWAEGKNGKGAKLNGSGARVTIPVAPLVSGLMKQFTMSAWAKPARYQIDWAWVANRERDDGTAEHYALGYFEGQPSASGIGSIGTYLIGTTKDTVDKWAFLAMTYDGSEMRLFLDGVLIDSKQVATSFSSDTTPLLVGCNSEDGSKTFTQCFDGVVDDLRIFDRALSGLELNEVMRSVGP